MIKQFQSSIKSTNLLVGYNIFSGYDVLKIASLIQIEADPIDYRKAARVIYNRLKIGMFCMKQLQLAQNMHVGNWLEVDMFCLFFQPVAIG